MEENNIVTDDLEVSESAEEVEVAEPLDNEVDETAEAENESTNEESTVEVEEVKQRDFEKDRIYADARRAAKKEQEALDEMFAKRFKDFTNPITGAAIKTQKDYLEALDAQERLENEEKLRATGVDMNMLQSYIDNSPQMKEARELKERLERMEAEKQVMADVEELSRLDSSIKTIDDIPEDIWNMCTTRGFNLVEAYKILNYGKITQQKAEATVQKAINQVKSKSQLSNIGSVTTAETLVEIPDNLLGMWQSNFPNKSKDELRKMYNKTLH